ncbi:hypothetical protein A2454_00600 [Candidatus Peribacteria bacterium RIFOXYC2_FULL_55_14]|nr:MAG: hypothetical protein UY87_C0016G0016 [Candidatus Peribacteria bacterium GW2011_GWC2_54_8]KKW40941.1 MAG: hypothetical protein UY90_C0067G0007 [Candidatus Peregrinibacteria bacterium GW2011_GWA2_54_9]OGJ71580.1 MAG: hypothetical protein A2198_05260 [Candidatus Peribacteria bacterium RIFOXYA1_FULL_56_14]OGJ72974.1 MAG: hypothetical protein A2217_06770 [Candidatus Peribacteria bacterium RIFOXYA2_FULL_55_28]OGJ73963.1 MAG: hypothetical protein A2384_05040 [Candidatus Peribacteria bacterium 
MLAEIGIMIGFYILTRMLTIERNKDGKVSSFGKVFAAVTFIITVIIVIDLAMRGFSATNSMPTF